MNFGFSLTSKIITVQAGANKAKSSGYYLIDNNILQKKK
jgi:hypothetical protein